MPDFAEEEMRSSLVASSRAATSPVTIQPGFSGTNSVLNYLPYNLPNSHPITGVVGHCFVWLCMWADFLASWLRRSQLARQTSTQNSRPQLRKWKARYRQSYRLD
jgi:hypothetical protein